MGSGKGILDLGAELVAGIAYIAYIVVGMALCAISAVYYSEIKDANQTIAVVLGVSGFAMMVVGGLALWSLFKSNVLVLKVVELLNVGLLVFVLGSAIVGIMLGLDVRDPIREAITRAWGPYSAPTETQVIYRESFWDSQVCTRNLVDVCEASFAAEATQAEASPISNYTKGGEVRQLFADCDYAKRGLPCTVDQGDTAACASAIQNAVSSQPEEACNNFDAGTSNGCLYINGTDGGDSCVPKPNCFATDALHANCETCNRECKEFAVDKAKDNLVPASYVVYATFAFCLICVIINDKLTNPEQMDTVWHNLGMVFNGVLAFTGFTLFIVAAVGQYYLSEDCQGDAVEDCSNPAIWFLSALGLALLFFGGLATFIIFKSLEGSAGCLALDTVNLVLLGISLPLLVCGFFLSISAGGIDSVHTQFDKHYPEMRKSVEYHNSNYCTTTAEDGGLVPMTDEQCRLKMTNELEEQVLIVGLIALCIAGGMVGVILVTKRSIRALSDDDDDDDGNGFKNPLDASE